MKHPLPPLDGLKAFEAAARHLSFSLAAEELCITKSAISYQIRKLEEHLQCDLFKRSVRQVYLTDGGQMLLQTTQSLFADLNETLARLQEGQEQNGVTVGVTTYVAARWLSKHISAFNTQFPAVNVLLQHSVNSVDFKLNDVDMAIRWEPCRPKPARNQFGQIPMALYPVASAQLLSRYNIKPKLASAQQFFTNPAFNTIPLLCEDRQQDLWQEWIDANIEASTKSDSSIKLTNPKRTISDANVRVQAAIDGQGLMLADEMMHNELQSSQLICPFSEKLHGYGYAFLYSGNRIQNQQAQTLKQWLAEHALDGTERPH